MKLRHLPAVFAFLLLLLMFSRSAGAAEPVIIQLDKELYTGFDDVVQVTLTIDPGLQTVPGDVYQLAVTCPTRDTTGITINMQETAPGTRIYQGNFGFSTEKGVPGKLRISDGSLAETEFIIQYYYPLQSGIWQRRYYYGNWQPAVTSAPDPAKIIFDNTDPEEALIQGLAGAAPAGALVDIYLDQEQSAKLTSISTDLTGGFEYTFDNSERNLTEIWLIAGRLGEYPSAAVGVSTSYRDVTPPKVDAYWPAQGAAGVIPTLTFDEPLILNIDTAIVSDGWAEYLFRLRLTEDALGVEWLSPENFAWVEGRTYNLVLPAGAVTDQAGNAWEQELNWGLPTEPDQTAPQVKITGVADGQRANTGFRPEITVQDVNLAETIISLNGVPYQSGTWIEAEGNYELRIEARDSCGNVVQVAYRFIIDYTGPQIQIVSPGENVTYSRQIELSYNLVAGFDDFDHYEVRLDALEWIDNGSAITYNFMDLAPGRHVLAVRAVDDLGNPGPVQSLNVDSRERPGDDRVKKSKRLIRITRDFWRFLLEDSVRQGILNSETTMFKMIDWINEFFKGGKEE